MSILKWRIQKKKRLVCNSEAIRPCARKCLMFCTSYEVIAVKIARMICMKLYGGALTLLEGHFMIYIDNCATVDSLFTNTYGSKTKQEKYQMNWLH